MPAAAERPRSSQEALLSLEKGTASPTTQLNEAAHIIGIDLALCASHPQTVKPVQTPQNTAPKEEWVLRWLLKKLRTGKNYRVESASFLLLKNLVHFIPPKSLATILKDQKFLDILNESVADLKDAVFAAVEEDGMNISTFAEAFGCSGSDTSHTLSDSPHENGRHRHGKKGIKRKRVDDDCNDGKGDPMDIDDQPQQSFASCILAFIALLSCLYNLVSLANGAPGVDEVASSHLKHALRGELESVAVALSRSFQIAAVATAQFSHWQAISELQQLFYLLPAILELWSLRSLRLDDAENKSSNDFFEKHCFVHALRLQLCVLSTELQVDGKSEVLHGLEQLIALHVVLPARAGFFGRGGSGIDYSADQPDWSPVQPITETFRPLFSKAVSERAELRGTHRNNKACGTAVLLPLFFETAVRSVPRDTFRRQTHEAPWLETLFVAVAELAFSIAKEENVSSTYIFDFVRVLEHLFRVVLDRKVQLSLHTLLAHAPYTGLLKDELERVEWNLTALLIKLDVDIFLPNSGLNDSGRLLNALLEKISLHWRQGTSREDPSYGTIKDSIVIPLMNGFASARDLSTFVRIWHEQLVAAEQARSQNNRLSIFTVWEDDDLCDAYGELVRTALIDAQLAVQIKFAAADVLTGEGKISNSPNAYASTVQLEASFRQRGLNFESLDEALNSIIKGLSGTLSSNDSLHWRWRLWRLARNLLEHNVQSTNNPLGAAIMGLVDVAANSIQHLHRSFMESSGSLLESFEAYRFAIVAAKDATNPGSFDSLTAEILGFLKSIAASYVSKPTNAPWNGRTETLDSPACLGLGYLFTLLRAPTIWRQIRPETRRSLFERMLSMAAAQYCPSWRSLDNVTSDARFVQAWASLVCHDYLLNVPRIVNDLVSLLCEKVKRDASNRKLYVESLQRIPTLLITRRHRATLLDLLFDILDEDNAVEVVVGVISLMAKLAEMPKSAAAVTGDWGHIWKMAKAISLQGTMDDLAITQGFRNLHRAVMDKLLVLSGEEQHKLFKKLHRRVTSKVSKLKSIECDSMVSFFLRISVSQLWAHRKQLSDVVNETELAACRARLFELVMAEIKSVKEQCKKHKFPGTTTLVKILDLLEDFEDLATANGDLKKLLSQIEGYIPPSDGHSGPSLGRLARQRILAGWRPKSNALPLMQCSETLPLEQLYDQELQLFVRTTTERFRSMTVESLGQVIKDVRETGGFTAENSVHPLLVVGLAVVSLPPIEDKDSTVAKELSSICTTITESLPHSTSIEQFSFATECLDVLLRHHTRCITQWNIDSLLTSISMCVSPLGPRISPEFAPTVYIRLCRLMGVLFNLHRQKLGGRFHLILPAMQRLLSCLFIYANKKRHISTRSNQQSPYWLGPLSASHATNFTRLLTTLCDPTVSAVSRPTHSFVNHEGLTDQTKKAKRIAGQYLQYLIMEYAQCSLRGSLAPEVKAAILPGLYAALDVMPRDTMRALNAGLDVSGRAVFKGLYDDYMRFGKWNKA